MSHYNLHFDLSQGCSAHSLCESLTNLGLSLSSSKDTSSLLDPVSKALYDKTLQALEIVNYKISQIEMEKILTFLKLLRELNPRAISATKIHFSFNPEQPTDTNFLKFTQNLPIYEHSWPGPQVDLISLALLKTCVSSFGPRGDSKLIKLGLAAKPETKALLCEPTPISSLNYTNSKPKVSPLIEASAVISNINILSELTHRLKKLGAKKTWSTQIFENCQTPQTRVTTICDSAQQNAIYEILLIVGESQEVEIKSVEQHSLQMRTVSVALNRPQKRLICRVTEYLFGDKILRADPYLEDLEAICKQTGYAQEIVRADVLSVWKKRSLNSN